MISQKNKRGGAVTEGDESQLSPEYFSLIRFLGENHYPLGVSYKFALIPEAFQETGWSLDKIHHMVMEARSLDYVTIFFSPKHGNWGQWEPRPQDLCAVSLTKNGSKIYNSHTINER